MSGWVLRTSASVLLKLDVCHPTQYMDLSTNPETLIISYCWVLWRLYHIRSDQRSVAQSCPTLCDPMNPSTPSLPVHHQLPEFTQTHAHRVSDAIQPCHPLSPPSPPALNLSQPRGLFCESVLRIWWPKYWSFSFSISPSNEHPGLISFRMD